MAGTEHTDPKLTASKSENMAREEVNWRKELDQNIKRLQSLLFGADIAIDKREFASAEILSLRLLGFLDSRCRNDADVSFTQPIRYEAFSKLDVARRALISESDRKAFEGAGRAPGIVFTRSGDSEIDKIKKSKYLHALLQQSNRSYVNEMDQGHKDMHVQKKQASSIPMCNTKSASLLGDTMRGKNFPDKNSLNYRSNCSDDCIILDQTLQGYNHPKGCSTSTNTEEEGHMQGNSLGVKRPHEETKSQRNECPKSPLSNEEANCGVSGDGFVSARIKMEMDAKQRRGLVGSPSTSVSPHSEKHSTSLGYSVRSYGVSRRGVRGNFIPPIKSSGGNTRNLTAPIGGTALDDSTKRWFVVHGSAYHY